MPSTPRHIWPGLRRDFARIERVHCLNKNLPVRLIQKENNRQHSGKRSVATARVVATGGLTGCATRWKLAGRKRSHCKSRKAAMVEETSWSPQGKRGSYHLPLGRP